MSVNDARIKQLEAVAKAKIEEIKSVLAAEKEFFRSSYSFAGEIKREKLRAADNTCWDKIQKASSDFEKIRYREAAQ